ncbi:hypothetical protein NA78x_004321 [Anatilimnocola sp. NA78]|uniref:HEAT repeat domain-containing protein n=1 Tax=Anatilimnocola sp. NA78 TaxID=3415683 RepID=UPI003CE53C6C
MHGTVTCPACGHRFFSAARGAAPIRCEQCSGSFSPQAAKANSSSPQVTVPKPAGPPKPQPIQPAAEQPLVMASLVPEPPAAPPQPNAGPVIPPHILQLQSPKPNPIQPNSSQPNTSEPKPSPPPFRPPPQPNLPSPNHTPIIVGCLALLGVFLIFCGGGAFLFFRVGSQAIAKAEREMRRADDIGPISPPPPVMRNIPPPRMPDRIPPRMPEFSPPRPPPEIPPVVMPPRPVMPPDFAPSRPMPPRGPISKRPDQLTDSEKLDAILKQLNDTNSGRPAWFALQELNRLPYQEDRRDDVSAALNVCLKSADFGSVRAATEALGKWGTQQNVPTLLEVLESPSSLGNRDVALALVKLSPTQATAEALVAKLENFSSQGAIRGALMELGPLAEEPLLARLETSTKRHDRMYIIQLLGEIGGEASRPLLQRIANSQDFIAKSAAGDALSKIDARKK